MVDSWRRSRAEDLESEGVLRVEDGNHGEYRPRPHEFGAGTTSFIRAADIEGGQISFRSAGRISDAALHRIRKGVGAPGDVIFSHKGTVGKIALAPDDAPPFVCSPQTTFWRSLNSEILDQEFLYYFMQSRAFIEQWRGRSNETDMAPYISLTNQRKLEVVVPPIGVQRSIAAALGTLDRKIDLNRNTNRNLESLAESLFRSWFVDFDPVVAKADEREPSAMDRATATLFPGAFVESELGAIPKGWGVQSLGTQFRLTMGQSPPGRTYNEVGYGELFFQGRADFGFRFPTPRVYCTEPKRFAHADDTLVSVRAPVGDVNRARDKCCIGRGLAAVRHHSGAASYTYYAMRSLRQQFDTFEAEGTIFGSMSKAKFSKIPVISPTPEVIAAFEDVAEPLDRKVMINTAEVETLLDLRELLLSKLLRGEILVEEREELVEIA